MPLFIDLETRSRVDLKKFGVYAYVECPDFDILMAAWSSDGVNVQVAIGRDQILEIPGLTDPKVLKIAHNAQFERVCFSRWFGLPSGSYLDPEDWFDTQALAGEEGRPQSLSDLARNIGAEDKDEAGTLLINKFCVPVSSGRRKGEWNDATTHPAEWLDFVLYCIQDVYTLIDVYNRLGEWDDHEYRIFQSDQTINDNGIAIDVSLAEAARDAAEANQQRQKETITLLSGIENPNSQQQIMRWFQEEGIKATNTRADTIEKLLEGDLTPVQTEVLQLKQELALVASKKYASALGMVCEDGRLRGTLKFFGAHTGRWAGRGTQLQNLPREAFTKRITLENGETEKVWDEEAEQRAIWELRMGLGASALDLKKLVRPLFTGPFTVVDYASIEARVVAWIAGEQWALDAFEAGRDIYVETAKAMGGLTRAQGKIAVLALGYNGGVNSLKNMGGAKAYYRDGKMVTGGTLGQAWSEDCILKDMEDEDLRELVYKWRRANPRIVKLWELVQNAVSDEGMAGSILRLERDLDTNLVKMWLPSGRAIWYHNMKWERYSFFDEEKGRIVHKEGWRYDNPKKDGPPRIGTYGGRLVENATQAIARDILAAALVRLQERGYKVVAHVHDEILVEGEHDVDEIASIMCEKPDWAVGLPIDAEGFRCERYRKA